MSLRIFNENNYHQRGNIGRGSMGQEWPGLRLPHHRPLLPHEKNYTDANSLYCLRGITSFKIRLDLVLFLFQNKEVRTFQNMVRNYKRKSDRAKYSADNLQRTLDAVKTKEMSLRAASKQFGIPRATIQKRLKCSHLPEPCNFGRFKRPFTIEMENQHQHHRLQKHPLLTHCLLQLDHFSIYPPHLP